MLCASVGAGSEGAAATLAASAPGASTRGATSLPMSAVTRTTPAAAEAR